MVDTKLIRITRQQRRAFTRYGTRNVSFTPVPKRLKPVLDPWAWPKPPSRERPTKNNDPAYRKSIWPAEKIARRLAK